MLICVELGKDCLPNPRLAWVLIRDRCLLPLGSILCKQHLLIKFNDNNHFHCLPMSVWVHEIVSLTLEWRFGGRKVLKSKWQWYNTPTKPRRPYHFSEEEEVMSLPLFNSKRWMVTSSVHFSQVQIPSTLTHKLMGNAQVLDNANSLPKFRR